MTSTAPEAQDDPNGRLRPDLFKLSQAFQTVAEELPRLSSLETNGIVEILEGLRLELQKINKKQDDLAERCTRIEVNLEKLAISSEKHEGLDATYTQKRNGDGLLAPELEDVKRHAHLNTSLGDSDQTIPPHNAKQVKNQNHVGIFHGHSGALIFTVITLLPIIAVLLWPESL